ncbi:MAG: hypothetical protein WBG70_17895 [Spirulinaceae cyanobacterium]
MLPEFIKAKYQQLQIGLSECYNKRSEKRREQFLTLTQPQLEIEFITQCFQNPNQKQCEVAIAVRNAIAKLGFVDTEFIRSEACFEELDLLPFWEKCGDAGFDSMLFVEAIEEELGTKFPNEQLDSLSESTRDPDLNTQMKILDFINDFYQWFIQYF